MTDAPAPAHEDGLIGAFLARYFGRSYRTTIAGLGALLCLVLSMLPQFANHGDALAKLATAIGGGGLLIAKDSRISGLPK